MSSKEATKEVEADEVIAADAKKDAVKGTKRPAEVSSCFYIIKEIFCMTVCESELGAHACSLLPKRRHWSLGLS